jgi:hypothetical protein
VEELAFNSLPAALTPDHRGIHYITCANSPTLTMRGTSGQFDNHFTMLPYRHGSHDYRCCPHNYGMGWPNYAEELWLATADNGLAASLYGASEVKAKVGSEATQVTVTQTTDYPFSDTIRFAISTPQDVNFPLYLRIPGWCQKAEVQINGEPVKANAVPLSYVVLDREWKNGDEVTLRLPMALSVRRWVKNNNSASVDYGPLTFSLLIPEKWERGGGNVDSRYNPPRVTKSDGGTDAWPEYEVRPAGPWNYGLVLEESNPAAGITLERRPGALADNPFTQDGAPLLLKAKAKRIPAWKLDDEEIVTPLEPSPVASDEPVETVTLIPMGAARLRITAFPVIGSGPGCLSVGPSAKTSAGQRFIHLPNRYCESPRRRPRAQEVQRSNHPAFHLVEPQRHTRVGAIRLQYLAHPHRIIGLLVRRRRRLPPPKILAPALQGRRPMEACRSHHALRSIPGLLQRDLLQASDHHRPPPRSPAPRRRLWRHPRMENRGGSEK